MRNEFYKNFLRLMTLMPIMAFAAPTVSDVTARQRYPWNGMVDIDYTVSDVIDPASVAVEITVVDQMNDKLYKPTKFLSALPVSNGRHRVTWSTEAEGIVIVSTNVTVKVALVSTDSALLTDNLCYIVDLSSGPNATSYPVTTMRAGPMTDWSDEFKTTKLVLRRLEAGNVPTHDGCRITQPFYIGVFEVTQKQYELVTGTNPRDQYKGEKRAVTTVLYGEIRGSLYGSGWPASSAVDANSFLGKLRSKTGIDFDLPTEAQWEYACRAGTTSKYNNGSDDEADLRILGRYSGNQNDGIGGYSEVTTVGSYAPNAWGVYDMLGNAEEWCLDWYASTGALSGDDPKGAASGTYRVVRGGGAGTYANYCTSSYRKTMEPTCTQTTIGFRLACSVGL